MSLAYLVEHRKKFKTLNALALKYYAKRVFHLPKLFSILGRRFFYIRRGAQIGPLTIVDKLDINGPLKNLIIGSRSFISEGVHLALHGQLDVGSFVVVNTNVVILTASHRTKSPDWEMYTAPVKIKDYAWIAFGATILPGLTIGEGAVVGAGAVVTKDVPDFAIVAGNPARVVGTRESNLNYSPVDLCAPYEAWLGYSKSHSKYRSL